MVAALAANSTEVGAVKVAPRWGKIAGRRLTARPTPSSTAGLLCGTL
jgi:hypothetical protein